MKGIYKVNVIFKAARSRSSGVLFRPLRTVILPTRVSSRLFRTLLRTQEGLVWDRKDLMRALTKLLRALLRLPRPPFKLLKDWLRP